MGAAPTKAGEITSAQSIIYQKIIDPNDITKVAQISFIDTGNVMPDGSKIYAMDVSGSELSIIAADSLKPDGAVSGEMVGIDAWVPLSNGDGKALIAIIQSDINNVDPFEIFTIRLFPGETIAIETVPDSSWIQLRGSVGDKIYQTILINSTL